MSTRKFVSIMIVALVLFVVALVPVTVFAEETYHIEAVVVGYGIAFSDSFEVEAVDKEGNSWLYYQDIEDTIDIGDVVVLTLWGNGKKEDDEVIDVEFVGQLDIKGILCWLED